MVPQNSLVTNFLQNIFLCVQQNKDSYRFGTTLGRVNDGIIYFWVNYFRAKYSDTAIYTQCTFRYLYSGTFPVLFNVLCLQENTFHIIAPDGL